MTILTHPIVIRSGADLAISLVWVPCRLPLWATCRFQPSWCRLRSPDSWNRGSTSSAYDSRAP
jgi:hypothetical protein